MVGVGDELCCGDDAVNTVDDDGRGACDVMPSSIADIGDARGAADVSTPLAGSGCCVTLPFC